MNFKFQQDLLNNRHPELSEGSRFFGFQPQNDKKYVSPIINNNVKKNLFNKINGKSHFGFTLIEMIIYMGILSILLLILSEIFVSILQTQLESEASSSVEQDGKFILQRLAYDVHRADSITLPASLGDAGSTLRLTINDTDYTYSSNSGNLEFTDSDGTDNLNSFDCTITQMNFQRIGNTGGNDTVKINFTIQSNTQKNAGYETRSYQTTAGLR